MLKLSSIFRICTPLKYNYGKLATFRKNVRQNSLLQPVKSAKLTATMANRRKKILQQARLLLAETDSGAFSLRKLAQASAVTVPTIYNLIGGKGAILMTLQSELLQRLEDSLVVFDDDHALEMSESIITNSIDIYRDDENYFRSAFIAMEQLGQAEVELTNLQHKLGLRAASTQTDAIKRAQKKQQLRGDIDATLLGEQIFRNYRHSLSEWVNHHTTLEQFENRALLGAYICLMADAYGPWQKLLREKIKLVSAAL